MMDVLIVQQLVMVAHSEAVDGGHEMIYVYVMQHHKICNAKVSFVENHHQKIANRLSLYLMAKLKFEIKIKINREKQMDKRKFALKHYLYYRVLFQYLQPDIWLPNERLPLQIFLYNLGIVPSDELEHRLHYICNILP